MLAENSQSKLSLLLKKLPYITFVNEKSIWLKFLYCSFEKAKN